MLHYPNPNFWRNKKVFLTGHTGFKGSWLSIWLNHLNAEVFGYALAPPSQPNLFQTTNVANGLTHFHGDVCDFTHLQQTLLSVRPDIILHLAAQPLVYHSYQYPVATYATNVMGTVHLLEAARHCPSAKVIINITSDKCYDNKEHHRGYQESDPMGGYDPYSNSKGCAELITSAYRNSFFNPTGYAQHGKALASVRAGNVIGGGDWGDNRLVPDLIKAFINNQSATIRNPDAIRPWQHVLEPLSGYLLLAEKMWHNPTDFAEGWNFGPTVQDMQPVRLLAEQMCTLWGAPPLTLEKPTHFPHEAQILKLDITKAKTRLNWSPRWNLDQALDAVVFWYKAWQNGQNMYEITLQQIKNYQGTAQDAKVSTTMSSF